MESYRGVVALDGPSGTGKSTVARKLAQRLDTRYLDTGAMYRAATLAVLRAAADPNDPEAVVKVVAHSVIVVSTDPVAPAVWLDGEPVDAEIRGTDVTQAVSAVSAVPELRSRLVAAQRELITDGGIVVVSVYVTTSPMVAEVGVTDLVSVGDSTVTMSEAVGL